MIDTLTAESHFQLFSGIDINEMSPFMHRLGLQLGKTTFELALIGYGDDKPIKIHSESVYHPEMCTYFMLACVKQADTGGENRIYDGEMAARLISEEMPELESVRMTYHAEHYEGTKVTVPLIRKFGETESLTFRQKFPFNEVAGLPNGLDEDSFYEYMDSVLDRCVQFEHLLEPGEVLLVNNYKTLHVRTAYTGLRKIIRVRVDDPAYVAIPNDQLVLTNQI
jgi:trimethyllysine dioxygenase